MSLVESIARQDLARRLRSVDKSLIDLIGAGVNGRTSRSLTPSGNAVAGGNGSAAPSATAVPRKHQRRPTEAAHDDARPTNRFLATTTLPLRRRACAETRSSSKESFPSVCANTKPVMLEIHRSVTFVSLVARCTEKSFRLAVWRMFLTGCALDLRFCQFLHLCRLARSNASLVTADV